MPDIPIDLLTERPEDGPAIDKLHERAFGPGRFARTAFRLREGVPPRLDLSFVARVGSMIVGSNRLTPIAIGGHPALLLGPLTVEPAFRSRGIGMALLQTSLEAAAADGHRLVILVGDEPYYGRIGFRRVPVGQVTLPGPVDPQRLLVKELAEGAFHGVAGMARGR
ncbi:GNAT family N-acetyltransferase [Labrys wisconsinensis]|uniref:N-acetyltransferase YhbS n=1 Tax=Labrys wisconsinensis TaxID=425677 RepID=A0ABU0JH50_9HYPH|nr:N-acetyltransferase [Labrys wisconsinensis]MDQ0473619.1 putative N-acetyltransferase YhbS [Labrys wisconsinensis]